MDLNSCLIVTMNIADSDRDALIARVDELIAQGINPEQAQTIAAGDMLANAEAELSDLESSIRDQHADLFEQEEETRREPYADAPDSLMGFNRLGPQKAFGQQKYKFVQYVRLSFPDGAADSFVDAMAGLNKAHAMERARRNWPTLTVEAISKEEAVQDDPGIEQAVDDAMKEGGLMFSARRGRFQLGDFGLGDRIIEATQDRYNRWKQSIAEVREQGGVISEDNDFYLAEERYWSKVGAQVEDFTAEVDEWVKAVVADGLDLGTVAEYAYAEHAKDRNAYVAGIRPNMPDGGSGMTDQEADDVLQAAAASGLEPELKRHAQKLRDWVQGTRDIMFADGLITQDEYDSWTLNMASYVPLRGLPPDSDILPPMGRGVGQGFNIRGDESKSIAGRKSRAKQIIENIIADRSRAIIRGGKNEVLKTFLKFVLDNPSPNLWRVNAVERRSIVRVDANGDREVVEVERVISDDRTVTVKDGGEEVHIQILDDRLREQMKNLNAEQMNKVIGAALMVNRVLARLYTSLNPVFTIINFTRDAMTAGFGAIDELGFLGAARMFSYMPWAARESFRHEFGSDPSGNIIRDLVTLRRAGPEYTEFRYTGGKTGFFDFKTIDELSEELNDLVRKSEMMAIDPRKLGPKLLDIIEKANAGFENIARLAVYKASKAQGKTEAEAAHISKNITVNFNRKGTMTPGLSAWFLFFNPAIQGTTRMLQGLKSPKVLSTLGLAMVGIAALALRNAGAGEDEDGIPWWDKVPNEVKERNLIFILPAGSSSGESIPGSQTGRYIKVPMPYGYNFFAVVANQIVDVWRNAQDPRHGRGAGEAFKNSFGAFMGSWVPVAEVGGALENSASLGLLLAPDALNPIAQARLNVNPFGRPLYPETRESEPLPNATKVFAGQAGTVFDKAATGLNEVSGGDAFEPGLFDLAPGQIEALVRGYLGGPATFTLDIINSVYARQSLERPELDVKRLPFAKQLYGVIDDETDRMVSYSRMEKVEEKVSRAKAAKDVGDTEAADRMSKEFGEIESLGNTLKRTRELLGKLRKEELAIIRDEKLSDAAKLAQMLELNKSRREVLQGFNRAYNEAMLSQRQRRDEERKP